MIPYPCRAIILADETTSQNKQSNCQSREGTKSHFPKVVQKRLFQEESLNTIYLQENGNYKETFNFYTPTGRETAHFHVEIKHVGAWGSHLIVINLFLNFSE